MIIATDGSAREFPARAIGWAWVASDGHTGGGHRPSGTAHEAELEAAAAALEEYAGVPDLTFQIDNNVVRHTVSVWARAWARRGWVKGDGNEPAQLDIVKRVYEVLRLRDKAGLPRVVTENVQAHSGTKMWPMHDVADRLARRASAVQCRLNEPHLERFDAPLELSAWSAWSCVDCGQQVVFGSSVTTPDGYQWVHVTCPTEGR